MARRVLMSADMLRVSRAGVDAGSPSTPFDLLFDSSRNTVQIWASGQVTGSITPAGFSIPFPALSFIPCGWVNRTSGNQVVPFDVYSGKDAIGNYYATLWAYRMYTDHILVHQNTLFDNHGNPITYGGSFAWNYVVLNVQMGT